MTDWNWGTESFDEAYDSARKSYEADTKAATALATRPLIQQSAAEEWAKATGTLAEDTAKSFLNASYKIEYENEVAKATQDALSSFLPTEGGEDPDAISAPLPALRENLPPAHDYSRETKLAMGASQAADVPEDVARQRDTLAARTPQDPLSALGESLEQHSPAFRGARESILQGGEIASSLEGAGVPSGVARPAGTALGVLGAVPRGYGQTMEKAAEVFGAPKGVSETVGEVSEALAPIPGDRFGALTKARLAATGVGAAAGAGAGAVVGDENAPGGMPGQILKGAAYGAQVGAPALDLAKGAVSVVGKVDEALDRLTPEMGGLKTVLERGEVRLSGPKRPSLAGQTVGEAIDRTAQMLEEGRNLPSGPQNEFERVLTDGWTKLGQHIIATETPLVRVQAVVEERLGRKLRPEENAALRMRLHAGRVPAAAQRITDELQPALEGLSKQDEIALETLLVQYDNAEKAASVGRRVERETLQAAEKQAGLGQSLQEAGKSAETLRARSVEAPNPLLPPRKTKDQVLAEAGPKAAEKGRLAAENRVFSGGVRAHPIDTVRAEFVTKYGQGKADQLFDAAQGIHSFTASLRQRMRDSGLISQEVFDDWAKNHASYIPTKILKYLPEDGAAAVPAGRSLMSIKDLGIKRLSEEGTAAARERPIDSLIRLTFAVENQIARQEGAKALDALRKVDPELNAMFTPRTTHKGARALGLKKGEYHYSGEGGYTPDTNTESTWAIFRDGNAEEYVVPKFLEPLFKLEPNQMQGAAKLAADVMEAVSGAPVLRATATALNPMFIPVNAIRDAIQFLVRSDLRKIHQTAPELARAYWDSVGKGGGPDWGEAIKAGAGMASPYFGLKPDAIRRRLLKEGHLGGRIRPAENLKDFMGAASDVLSVMATPVRATGEAVERAPRLAAYRLAKKAGMTDAEAALAARDITIDFARGGDLTKFFNRFIPFLAVGVQGVERSITDWKKMPGAMAAGAATGIAASLTAEAWNRSYFEEEYRDVPDYLRETGIVLVTPLKLPPKKDGSRRGNLVLWLPIPNEYQLLKSVVNEGVSRKNGDTPDDWRKVFSTLARTISPVGTDTVPLPPTAQTAVELGSNYDFFRGREVVPDRYQNLPPGRQADERTPAGAKAIGQALGVSPFQVEHLTRGILSGIGGMALEATNEAARLTGGEAPPRNNTGTLTDVPVAGGLAGRFLRTTAQGQRARDTRDQWTARQNAVRDERLAALRQIDAYRRATPEQKREAERLLSNQIAADFNEARSAVNAADRAGKPLPTPPPQAPRTLVGARR